MQKTWAHVQTRRSYPEFVAEFDRLTPEDIVWEPYSPSAIAARAPLGISSVCTLDQGLWMTTVTLVYDVAVEAHALFLTATALVTRRRALPLRHHRLHHLQWVDTAEKAQRSLLRGGTATRTTLVLVTCCIIVFILFFLNYLRHVRLVRNLFTVVCNGF